MIMIITAQSLRHSGLISIQWYSSVLLQGGCENIFGFSCNGKLALSF